MNTRYILFFFLIALTLLSSTCEGRGQSGECAFTADSSQKAFPYPQIPELLQEPEARKAYLMEHYWQDFDFEDTALVNNRDITEQGTVNFLALMTDADSNLNRTSMENLCQYMAPHEGARMVMAGIMEDYLYNPNSPYHDETLYRLFVRALLNREHLDDAERSRLTFQYTLMNRNNAGQQATNFTYILQDGSKHTLHHTPVQGKHLLLVFHDPECTSCHEVMEQLRTHTALAKAVKEKKLTVLAVYTEANEAAWQDACHTLPAAWITAMDLQQVKEQALYDLKAMPSIYLLDRHLNVVLKDATLNEVCHHLHLQ